MQTSKSTDIKRIAIARRCIYVQILHHCWIDVDVSADMGPNSQKAAYGVPLSAKGTNETNLQMVFGTGTFGYRTDDLQVDTMLAYGPSTLVCAK